MKEKNFWIGKYRLTNFVVLPTGKIEVLSQSGWIKNLITNAGRTLLQNRIVSNGQNAINTIALGTGTNPPQLSNTSLQTETVRKAANYTISGTPNWTVSLNAIFTAAEINGAREIGLLNNSTSGGTLATRSLFPAAISIPPGSNMGIDYALIMQTARMEVQWTQESEPNTDVYSTPESNAVKGVLELDSGNGYLLKASVAQVQATAGTYFYDSVANTLYIHCLTGTPADHTLEIITGG